MDRPQEILPGKGIEAQTVTAVEIREEWIQHASMAMFEDYSEQYSDDFPNLNQWFFQEWVDDSGTGVPVWNSFSEAITEKFPGTNLPGGYRWLSAGFSDRRTHREKYSASGKAQVLHRWSELFPRDRPNQPWGGSLRSRTVGHAARLPWEWVFVGDGWHRFEHSHPSFPGSWSLRLLPGHRARPIRHGCRRTWHRLTLPWWCRSVLPEH